MLNKRHQEAQVSICNVCYIQYAHHILDFISCIHYLRYSYQYIILIGNRDRRGTNATSAELGTLKMCETTFITDATHV